VSFDSSSSTGDPTGFQWDFDGDAIVDSTDPMPTWTYPSVTTSTNYTVTLTVINITGVDVEVKTNYVTVAPAPTGTATTAPTSTPQPTPSCVHPPDVVGKLLWDGQAILQAAGFPNTTTQLTTGPKNKIQAQNPDATQCKPLGTTIVLAYRPN
jgi:hypothetical protein